MKKWMFMFLFIFSCFVACNSAMRDGAMPPALKADMPNTIKLDNGEVVYDLRGEWNASTTTGCGAMFSGTMRINQEGNQFVGIMQDGNYPHSTPREKVKGTLKGPDIVKCQFYTTYGWINSFAEITNVGNEIAIDAGLPECTPASTRLKRK